MFRPYHLSIDGCVLSFLLFLKTFVYSIFISFYTFHIIIHDISHTSEVFWLDLLI